jgi:hypothetical protein
VITKIRLWLGIRTAAVFLLPMEATVVRITAAGLKRERVVWLAPPTEASFRLGRRVGRA